MTHLLYDTPNMFGGYESQKFESKYDARPSAEDAPYKSIPSRDVMPR